MSTAQIVTENGHQSIRLPDEIRLEGDEVVVKRVGRSLLLIPRDADRWAMFTASLEQFTDDYMQERQQPAQQVRTTPFEQHLLKYLLDTNICIFVIRQRPPLVLQRFQQFQPDELGISTVTLAELRYGADKSSDPAKNHASLDGFLAAIDVIDFDSPAADWYGVVRADLERRGRPIGPLDMMIAAHALRLALPLVTNNVAEFTRVAGLVVEDWTAP